MPRRQERHAGTAWLTHASAVLARNRLADPFFGMWEAADLEWWWRRPRASDGFLLPVWFDADGPVAALQLSTWGERTQVDLHLVRGRFDVAEAVPYAEQLLAEHASGAMDVLARRADEEICQFATALGLQPTEEVTGTCWMDLSRPIDVSPVVGFTVQSRAERPGQAHQMIARNGLDVERRLRETELYREDLDLCLVTPDGEVAGYALMWLDPRTQVGLVEPVRVEDRFSGQGLGQLIVSSGLARLAASGARRAKVGFMTETARRLYLRCGFERTSHDVTFTR